jgi:hypothetical protein
MTLPAFAFMVVGTLTISIAWWYVGYQRGRRDGTDEMRVHLDTALKMRKVIVSADQSHDPETAELLSLLRAQAKAQHPAGKGDQ